MNQSDLLKFLSQNNLNYAYNTGNYMLNNYSLPEAVSLFGAQTYPDQNAYDLIHYSRNKDLVQVNCGKISDTFMTIIPSTTTLISNRGNITTYGAEFLNFLPFEKNWGVLCFYTNNVAAETAYYKIYNNIAFSTNFDLPFGSFCESEGFAVHYEDGNYTAQQYCYGYVMENTFYTIDEMYTFINSDAIASNGYVSTRQIFDTETRFNDYRIVFWNKLTSEIHFAKFDMNNYHLVTRGNTLYDTDLDPFSDIYIYCNYAYYLPVSSQTITESATPLTINIEYLFETEAVKKWLQTIPLYKPTIKRDF